MWALKLSGQARTELRALDDVVHAEVVATLQELREEPFPEGAIELRSKPHVWRVKVHRGRYRILYRVSEGKHSLFVLRIRRRETAYVGFERR